MSALRNKLEGKKVVILGGTSGFGLATARAATQAGAQVIIASRSQANVDNALAELPAGVTGATVDVTDEASLTRFFASLNGFDHLVVTAGDTMPAFQPNLQQARQAFEVRFWGAYLAATASGPHIRPGGSITLTNGIVAIRPWKGWSATAAVAGAVESLTRSLALDLAPIRVNSVCAGMVRTPLWSPISESEREAMYADTASKLPTGRIGEPEDIAETYLYLMQSGFTTGQIVVIDGGAVIS
ncbi:SDR family oxidoreductase [Edaphobacter aggregans]|uniref:SDR family oxidoreductase n=1 Tax=Edaphobacter aggregans TaxID=570835 RepID=UPI00054DD9C7|nr:SDR family oxidoreductase [Edaphobacter aggregans]